MANTAAHLVDRVLPPNVPVRQYVLSLPYELRRLAADAGPRPWLVVITRRPAEDAGAVADGVTRIDLEPLGPEAAEALLAQITADSPLPPYKLSMLARRAGGICTAQITLASSVTQSSSAVRPYRGKLTRTVCSHGGAPAGTRCSCASWSPRCATEAIPTTCRNRSRRQSRRTSTGSLRITAG